MSVRDSFRIGGGLVATIAAAMLFAILVASMQIFGWGWFQRSTADFRGKTGQIEQVKADPNYRIAAYDRFFDLCASIQGKEDAILVLEDERDTTYPSEARLNQINTSLTALYASRASLIRQYNADARKEDTRANFRASDLPFELDPNEEETSCTAPEE